MKINVEDRSQQSLVRRFGVKGLPTIIILEPDGRRFYSDSGAPHAEGFVDYFANKTYNALVGAYNDQNAARAARPAFFLRKWFAGTKLAKRGEKLITWLEQNDPKFPPAYAAVAKDYKARIDKVYAARQAHKDRAKRAAQRQRDARALYKHGRAQAKKRQTKKSIATYKRVIAEYPETPAAEDARVILKRKRIKWKEPER